MSIPRSKVLRPVARLLTALTLSVGLFAGAGVTVAAPVQAAVSAGVPAAVAAHAVRITAGKKGAPYQYGAMGPTRFDCSGLTKWVYRQAGRTLPRTAAQQYAATIRVTKAQARPGDLVFFMSAGRVYHVGVYAGAGRVWHAPKTGDRVKLAVIWTSAVRYGRVR
jgi:cell wall-associated NlpC family hydrolase